MRLIYRQHVLLYWTLILIMSITLHECILQVVVLPNIRPKYEHFESATTVNESNTEVFRSASRLGNDTFYYVGILPTKNTIWAIAGVNKPGEGEGPVLSYRNRERLITVNYSIGFELPTCASWIAAGRYWNSSTCAVRFKNCFCSFSLYFFSAIVQNF